MANRVTSLEVKQILETSLSDNIVKVFITSANTIVTDTLGSDTTLSTTQLKEIEMWLAAHLIASTRERQAQEVKVGDATAKYTGKTGMGLDGTTYGQQVKMLDATGKLAQKLGKKSATIKSITSFST